MKKGMKMIGASGIILMMAAGAVACQERQSMPEESKIESELEESREETELKKVENTKATKESQGETKKKKESDKEKESDKKETSKKETSSKKETNKESSDKKNDNKNTGVATTKPTQNGNTSKPNKPAETKPNRPAETKPSKPAETQPSKPAETQPSKPVETQPSKPVETQHIHNWVEQTKTVHHEAEGHYETVVVQAAWDEPIYKNRVVCGCGDIFTDVNEWGQHSIDGCPYSYSILPVLVETKHHEAVTEQQWVEDKAAWDETVVTGYKCSTCGETK